MTDLTLGVSDSPLAKGAAVAHFEKIVDTGAVNLTAAAHELFDIPAGMMHLSTVVDVLTAEGGVATIDIGDTDVDSLIDGADVNQIATPHVSGDGATAEVYSLQGTGAGKLLLADTTFSLTANNALDAAVFRVKSVWIDMRNALNDPAA